MIQESSRSKQQPTSSVKDADPDRFHRAANRLTRWEAFPWHKSYQSWVVTTAMAVIDTYRHNSHVCITMSQEPGGHFNIIQGPPGCCVGHLLRHARNLSVTPWAHPRSPGHDWGHHRRRHACSTRHLCSQGHKLDPVSTWGSKNSQYRGTLSYWIEQFYQ